jgi:hypothetical protein
MPGHRGFRGMARGAWRTGPQDLARVLWRKLRIPMALAPSLAGRRRGRPPGASLADAIDARGGPRWQGQWQGSALRCHSVKGGADSAIQKGD